MFGHDAAFNTSGKNPGPMKLRILGADCASASKPFQRDPKHDGARTLKCAPHDTSAPHSSDPMSPLTLKITMSSWENVTQTANPQTMRPSSPRLRDSLCKSDAKSATRKESAASESSSGDNTAIHDDKVAHHVSQACGLFLLVPRWENQTFVDSDSDSTCRSAGSDPESIEEYSNTRRVTRSSTLDERSILNDPFFCSSNRVLTASGPRPRR